MFLPPHGVACDVDGQTGLTATIVSVVDGPISMFNSNQVRLMKMSNEDCGVVMWEAETVGDCLSLKEF